MKIHAVVAAAAMLVNAALATAAPGQPYPEKTVRVLVGLAAGGGTDTVGRVMMQKFADVFGQSFVVDNRPSAGGNVAGELAARAAPDGYTLLVVTPTHVVNPSLYRNLHYDIIRDFAPVGLMVYAQYFLSVSNALPVTSLNDLLALAKSQPQRLTYASSGISGTNHLAGELFKTMAGIEMVHVPYKGGGLALSALISGEVQVSFTSSVAIAHAKAGRVRILASTGTKRTAVAPEIPTIAESGVPGYEVSGWYGLAAPAKTPAAVIELLNVTMNRVLPELRERYFNLGMDLGGGTPAEFGAFLKSELEKWARVVKISGAKIE